MDVQERQAERSAMELIENEEAEKQAQVCVKLSGGEWECGRMGGWLRLCVGTYRIHGHDV